MEPKAAGKVIGEKKAKPRQRQGNCIGLVVVVVVVIAGIMIWKFLQSHAPKAGSCVEEKMAFLCLISLYRRTTFYEYEWRPKQEYFCDGLTEQNYH